MPRPAKALTTHPTSTTWVPPRHHPLKGIPAMSAADKIKNAAEDLKGKAKEATGKATDDK